MTVTNTSRVLTYNGDGNTTSFTTPAYTNSANITVTHIDANGVETVWTEGTEYTITGANNAAGGTLTVSVLPTDFTPATGEQLRILRTVPYDQQQDISGEFRASTVEIGLDNLARQTGQLAEIAERSIKLDIGDSGTNQLITEAASARANKVVGFDSNGDLTLTGGVTASDVGRFSFTIQNPTATYNLIDTTTGLELNADNAVVWAVVGNGNNLQQGTDFTVSGSTITLTTVDLDATDGLTCFGYVSTAFTSGEVRAGAVGTAQLASGAVTDAKISDVNGSKIATASIALAALADQSAAGILAFLPNGDASFLTAPLIANRRLTTAADGSLSFQFSSFFNDRAVFLHRQSTGVGGGNAVAVSRNTIPLNVVDTNTITDVSLNTSTGVLTLPAGTYMIDAGSSAYNVFGAKLYLYNITDAGDVAKFNGVAVRSASNTSIIARGRGWFTLSGTKDLRLELWTTSNQSVNGLGFPLGDGNDEIYADVFLWKVA